MVWMRDSQQRIENGPVPLYWFCRQVQLSTPFPEGNPVTVLGNYRLNVQRGHAAFTSPLTFFRTHVPRSALARYLDSVFSSVSIIGFSRLYVPSLDSLQCYAATPMLRIIYEYSVYASEQLHK